MMIIASSLSASGTWYFTFTLASCIDQDIRRIYMKLISLSFLDCFAQKDIVA